MKKTFAILITALLMSGSAMAEQISATPGNDILSSVSWSNSDMLSIISPGNTYAPGSAATFTISSSALPIDSNCNDGFCQVNWGGWALYDSGKNLVMSSQAWKSVSTSYQDSVTITLPTRTGQYAFVAVVDQINMTYTPGSTCPNYWCNSADSVIYKEGAAVTVQVPPPVNIPNPSSDFFSGVLQMISDGFNWFLGLFGL